MGEELSEVVVKESEELVRASFYKVVHTGIATFHREDGKIRIGVYGSPCLNNEITIPSAEYNGEFGAEDRTKSAQKNYPVIAVYHEERLVCVSGDKNGKR